MFWVWSKATLHLGDQCVLYESLITLTKLHSYTLWLVPVCRSHLWMKDDSDRQQNIKGDNWGLLPRLWCCQALALSPVPVHHDSLSPSTVTPGDAHHTV